MKKIFLSAIVVISVVSYALYLATKSAIQPSTNIPTPQLIAPTISQQNVLSTDKIYTGSVADAIYGNVQVQITIAEGKITKVNFLQYPNDQETSTAINQRANPLLAQEAIEAQSEKVDIVSGATLTSQAFVKSLQSALAQTGH